MAGVTFVAASRELLCTGGLLQSSATDGFVLGRWRVAVWRGTVVRAFCGVSCLVCARFSGWGWFAGMLALAGSGRGDGWSGHAVQQQQVMRDAGEEELAGGVAQAAHGEPAQAGAVLEAGVQAFNVGGAALVSGAAFGGTQPPVVGLGGAGVFGRRAFGGSWRACLSRLRRLPVAVSRSGPGAVILSSE